MADKDPLEGTAGDVTRLCLAFGSVALLGILGVWLFNPSALGAELIVSLAAALIGGVVGFVFAVPRSRRGQNDVQPTQKDELHSSDYTANTNLEQISDWLTKILVGAGLVELKDLPGYLNNVAASLAPAIGDEVSARPVVVCLLGCFGAWGFSFAYLLTRLWLPKALKRAEHEDAVQKLHIESELKRAEHEDAVQKLQIESAVELRDVERKAYDHLYEAAPEGFENAISTIRNYLGKPGSRESGWLWTYLAAAYGQKYSYEKQQGRDRDALITGGLAVDAVKKAVSLDPGSKDILGRLLSGDDPSENDLADLKDNAELKRLLGK